MSKNIPTITDDDFEKLLGDVNSCRDELLLLFMFDAGLRVSEVCKLQIRDVFVPIQQISGMHQPIFEILQTVTIRAEITKNSRYREIPMTDRLRLTLTPYVSTLYFRDPPALDKALFPGCNGRFYLSPRAVQKLIQSVSERCLRRRIHPHVLRHSFATRLMRKAPISVVQQLLGHKSITSTQVYMHPVISDAIKAIAEIQKP